MPLSKLAEKWIEAHEDHEALVNLIPDMLAALQFFCDATGPMFFNITPETEGTLTPDKRQILRAYRNAQRVMQMVGKR
jgi:hypothetical protein